MYDKISIMPYEDYQRKHSLRIYERSSAISSLSVLYDIRLSADACVLN